jgi:parallel beta-helix repeat protein
MILISVTGAVFAIETIKASGNTLYVCGGNPANYNTIQSAIDAASSGDTVFVYNGIYYENVIIDKSISLIGEDKNSAIIDAEFIGSPIRIEHGADNVIIKDFKIIRSGGSAGGKAGIIVRSEGNKILDCNIIDNRDGIDLSYSHNNIVDNVILDNSNEGYGIIIFHSNNNLIENCVFQKSRTGIFISVSSGNRINNTDILGLYQGIEFRGNSNSNTIENCLISDSQTPILLRESHSNIFRKNNIVDNWQMSRFDYSSNNILYLNTFSNHDGVNVRDIGSLNIWNSPEPIVYTYGNNEYTSYLGNYWNDYTGEDNDNDGIGDTPHQIWMNDNEDNFPLMVPWGEDIENIPPTAGFSYSPSNPSVDDTIQFTDTSYDSDGTITSWSWNFGDGGSSTIKNPQHQYTTSGTYTVTLEVTDNDGAKNSISQTINVGESAPPNIPPSADFSYTPSNPTTDDVMQFTDLSTDPDGSIHSWLWNFGDGETSTNRNPKHRYLSDGTYSVSLTVNDNDGATDLIVKDILIGEPSGGDPAGATDSNDKTPGFEIIISLAAIALALIFFKKEIIT